MRLNISFFTNDSELCGLSKIKNITCLQNEISAKTDIYIIDTDTHPEMLLKGLSPCIVLYGKNTDIPDIKPEERLIKPIVDADVLLSVFRIIRKGLGNNQKEKVRADVVGMLIALGIPVTQKGIYYTADAVMMRIAKPGIGKTEITKRLCEEYNTSAYSVEHAIRRSSEWVWDKGNAELAYRIFGNAISPDAGKLTAYGFIAGLAEHFRCKIL